MGDNKKIGIVLSSVPAYSETFFRSKIKGLISRGFDVKLFVDHTKVKSDIEYVCGPKNRKNNILFHVFSVAVILLRLFLFSNRRLFRFIYLERKDRRPWGVVIRNIYFSAHILRYDPDWLHFGFITHALDKENVAKAVGAKMAVGFRGYDINIYPLKRPGCYDKIWNKADKVHSISDHLYHKALEYGLNKNIPYMKITPAIDVRSFLPDAGKSTGKVLNIVTIARLSWIKGLEYALRSMAVLKDKGISFRYLIVGTGPEEERVKYAAFQLGLKDNVIFPGKKKHDEVAEILKSCDIYLQPSVDEGFCNAMLEAQAAGCLCIATEAGGLKENIVDGITGWLVPKRDPEAMAEKILEINRLPEKEKDSVRKNAIERIKTDFSLDNQIRKFAAFYTEQ
jgi:colanic acid/amylovoran biosynthesis glycosyltransferase